MKLPAQRVQKTRKTNPRQILNAAVIVINPEWDQEEGRPKGYIWGATRGGVSVQSETVWRTIEYDGTSGFKTIGDELMESANVTVTAQLAELTTASLQKIAKADITELPDGRKILQPRRTVKDEDYIPKIGVVGFTKDGDWMMIEVDNVFITSPFDFQTEDNGTLTMEVVFEARLDANDLMNEDYDELPYRIITSAAMNPAKGEFKAIVDGVVEEPTEELGQLPVEEEGGE